MNTAPNLRLVLGLVVAAAPLDWASAQDSDPAQALRGPEVAEQSRRTIVHRSMTGEFRRVEGRPEAAALQVLGLDEATLARARGVIDARDMAVAMLLVDEIDAMKVISDAVRAGEGEEARELIAALWGRFEPDSPESPLLAPLGEVIAEADGAELARMVEEYWRAWVEWEMRAERETDQAEREAAADRTRRRLAFQLFEEEVRAGYEATLRRYRDAMETIYAAVEPTDEQRVQIREIFVEYIRETRLNATAAERRAATRRIYDLLDEERRGKLFDHLLRQLVPDNR